MQELLRVSETEHGVIIFNVVLGQQDVDFLALLVSTSSVHSNSLVHRF